jgi:Ni/Fe-hydrogenase b-type cytochrome subunit
MKMWTRIVFAVAVLLVASPAIVSANGMHPAVPLLDAQGQAVVESGAPLSTMQTCGGECHDVTYIMAHSDHADAGARQLGQDDRLHAWQVGPGYYGGWNPLSYSLAGLGTGDRVDAEAWLQANGARHVGGGPVAGLVEMNCLLCHSDLENHTARAELLARGEFSWANSAPLAELDVLTETEQGWQWNAEQFTEDGSLREGLLDIRKPQDENCAQCHGIADNRLDQPLTIDPDPARRISTDRTGQLISPQKLNNSGINLAGKEARAHPFDVHADRVVGCVNCHYSLNNPVYFRQREESRPDHLSFDPRRLGLSDYLDKPLHQFAKGKSTLGLAAQTENSLRRCESCHDAVNVHGWLPYRQRHFSALACESCHVPELFGPALQLIDWTVLDADGEPVRSFRNLEGDPAAVDTLVEGFEPILLPRRNGDSGYRLAPWNLVTSWYWLAGSTSRPVPREQLAAAMLKDGGHHPDLVTALDADGNGVLEAQELALDSEASVEAVRARLAATGIENPWIAGEVLPFAISHNVVNGRWATRECRHCHSSDSDLSAAFTLSAHQPPGARLKFPQGLGIEMAGELSVKGGNGIEFLPDASQAGFYVLGLHSFPWADLLGLVMFFGVVLGVSGHALGRYIATRRRPASHQATARVYMYDAYERLWHWLQAIAILLLLFTGLVIHKPDVFGIFSFSYVVQVHNVLGFILLINAALALFYNLASGEIRQYLPKPHGFIGRSVAQAMYYTRGIFAGQPHPIEKTKEQKLNPLQQITYLGILNVLLPAQVITGVLIWGLQRWPHLAELLGGFQALALVHTLVAWAFAAFIVMHVYLTTAAGHTPAAGIRAMIEGWDEVEQAGSGAQKGVE